MLFSGYVGHIQKNYLPAPRILQKRGSGESIFLYMPRIVPMQSDKQKKYIFGRFDSGLSRLGLQNERIFKIMTWYNCT